MYDTNSRLDQERLRRLVKMLEKARDGGAEEITNLIRECGCEGMEK